jgi:tetratricopeptide (TPR) repeat protein/2-polyprenyl-3-methyl-5-hydroxy-6-metoxy-1,4-benzoquinol methylase
MHVGTLPFGGRLPPPAIHRLFDLALEHHRAGRLTEADGLYRRILEHDPDHADALNSLGFLAHQCGHSEAALELIGRAIARNDRIAPYHYNIALVLAALGRMDEAVTHNRRAIALKPDFADAHTNLASALAMLGKLDEAVTHFRRALARQPDSPLAYLNLASALHQDGRAEEALGIAVRGLAAKETDELKAMFVLCAGALASVPRLAGLRALVERAIAECWGPPSELAGLATALVQQGAPIAAAVARVSCWPQRLSGPALDGVLAAAAGDRLLQALLQATPIRDIVLERLLSNARRAALDLVATDSADASENVLTFCCALARQCFINEYVFDLTGEEAGRSSALREQLARALDAGTPVAPLLLAVVAMYEPLHAVAPVEAFQRDWPPAAAALVAQQVREPAEEQALRAAIPALTAIEDEMSARVRRQYEENPYPRWTAVAALSRRLTFDEQMRILFPQARYRPLGKSEVDVLIAGCGTGRHAIETARLCVGAKVLAVDLSLASLAYAQRKTRELGVANLEYAQADLLRLGALPHAFDVIEAVGVLHHLRDPPEGWRALLALLRPNGYMRVGLYSALARQDVVAAREFIAGRGYRDTADDIRRCRQALLALPDGAPAKSVTASPDFFSVSGCRDFMFHAQEHRTGILEIKALLAANDLTFIGFDTPARGAYAKLHPDDPAMSDLDRWHAFEVDHPATFKGMYQFWVQRAEAPSPPPYSS